jgi:hypothetical protein
MHNQIPDLQDITLAAMNCWFADMAAANMLFHPEDAANSIVYISNGKPFFSSDAAEKAQQILDRLFQHFGSATVIESAYPHFMRAAGFQ